MRNKSKSLDRSYCAGAGPGSLQQADLPTKPRKQEGSFLSRLFGSRRHKMKSSLSQKDLTSLSAQVCRCSISTGGAGCFLHQNTIRAVPT